MLKYLISFLAVIGLIVGGFYVLNEYIYNEKQGGAVDYKNATYMIDGESITLVDGKGDGAEYFGNEAKGDVNNDGIPDIAFILTYNGGGSGTFYYAVVGFQNAAGKYNGSNGILLGDRIAPQTTEIRNSIVIVNYADRKPEDPFTTQPSVGKTAYLYYDVGELKAQWPVMLYVYNAKLDTDAAGNILCSEKGLVPIARMIPDADIEATVRHLLKGGLIEAEVTQGLTTEFPLEGVELTSSANTNGTLTFTLNDPLHKTSGGACRAGILRAQIEATAKQFPGVQEVKFEPAELFQP